MNDSRTKNAYADNNQNSSDSKKSKITIPVIEEEIKVEKEIVETGKVRISKKISEHEELFDEPLLREEVAVMRVPFNQYIDAVPQPREEGDTLIIPVMREELVIQKKLVLVEELHIKKQVVQEHKPQSVTLHKEEVEITRINADDE